MASVIETLEDEIYDHSIRINRFEEGVKRRAIGFLREMTDDINHLLSESPTAMQSTRLKSMLTQVDDIIADAHKSAQKDVRGQLVDFAKAENESINDIMNQSMRAEIFSPKMTSGQLRAVVDDSLIRGAVAGDWWDRLEKNTQNRITKGIQLGYAEGESIEDMKDRLLGKRTGVSEIYTTRDGRTKKRAIRVGGWAQVSDREAESLIRTSVHNISSTVRDQTYKDNLDVIDAVQSVATLDGRTTMICASYDGLRWTADGHEPIGGHGKNYLPTPRHWNCRSTHVPVISDLDKLDQLAKTKGIKIPSATRASISGPQRATMSMDKWLKKPANTERLNLIVGNKAKADLFREGRLKLQDFTNRRGDPISIDELRKKARVVKKVVYNPEGLDTLNQYSDGEGNYTPERTKLHEKITDGFIKGKQKQTQPIFHMMGGGPASGKSVLMKQGKANVPPSSVFIDPDEIKKELPEYQKMVKKKDMTASSFVHEEASLLSKDILNLSGEERFNTVLDGTGDSSFEKLSGKVNKMKSKGMYVTADYVTVDIDTALQRNLDRFKKTGRAVPIRYVVDNHKSISEILPQAIDEGLFDELTLWDTNGATAVKVVQFKDGVLEILEKEMWQTFLDKKNYKIKE